MNDVFRAAEEVQSFCEKRNWRFCFIGGIAVQRWSNPRQTEDVDLTLLTGFGEEDEYVDALLSAFAARTDGEREAAPKRRVALLYSAEKVGIDIALGGLPFEEHCVERASEWLLTPDLTLRTCSADDLIVHKAFASRDQDWADVEGIVMRQGPRLNLEQIWTELRPLVELKEEPEILVKLQKIFDRHLD